MSSPLPPVASRSGGLRGNGNRRYDGEEVGAEIGAGGLQGRGGACPGEKAVIYSPDCLFLLSVAEPSLPPRHICSIGLGVCMFIDEPPGWTSLVGSQRMGFVVLRRCYGFVQSAGKYNPPQAADQGMGPQCKGKEEYSWKIPRERGRAGRADRLRRPSAGN